MGKLRDPSIDLRKRLLTEVGFENRLVGFSLHIHTGLNPVTIYNFEKANPIADAVRKERSDKNRSLLIKEFLEERLDQCKRFLWPI